MSSFLSKLLNLNIPIVLFPKTSKQKQKQKQEKKSKSLSKNKNAPVEFHDPSRRHRRHSVYSSSSSSSGSDHYLPYYDYDYDYSDHYPNRYDNFLYEKKKANPKTNLKGSKNNFIITFKNTTDTDAKIDDLNKKSGFKHKHKLSKALNGCTATVDNSLLSELFNDPDIQYIEKDSVVTDTLYEKVEYKLSAASVLWNQTITNTVPILTDNFSSVHCYVLDTGIMPTHSEFVPGQVIIDYNTIAQNKSAIDDNGHGTGVASVIGGRTVGSAIKTTLHSIKVLDSTGSGYTSNIIAGIDWVLANKNTTNKVIINLSLGGSSSTSLNNAIQNAIINNCVVVCAAGNDGIDATTVSPANASGAITVSAYDSNKTKPSWSNFGPVISTFAPGSSVKAAWNDTINTYYSVSGTSFSSPLTAGIIARYLKIVPNPTQMQIVSFINKSNLPNEIINPGANTPNTRIVWNSSNTSPC
jgi:hypothetical protein